MFGCGARFAQATNPQTRSVQTPEQHAQPAGGAPAPRTRALDEVPALATRAAELLCTPSALAPLSLDDARQVVAFMRLVTFPTGTVLFHEGERAGTSYLLLILDGQVTVDLGASQGPDSVTISAIGPGSIIGEMSLLDGAPRSAQCTAMTPITAGGLSRGGLERLIEEHPKVAAKLVIGLAQRLADRVRALGQQVQIYSQLAGGPGQDVPTQQLRRRE
jgi:CRP/FNR family cyclic AMP-dependent transcriptional regulator